MQAAMQVCRNGNFCLRERAAIRLFRIGLLACALALVRDVANGQGTAFTYQGFLNKDGSAVTGTNAMKFSVWNAVSSGAIVGTPVTNLTVPISNGFFTVNLDFGGGVFTGPERWLEIGVGTNNVFTLLSPRQKITSTPYAVMAGSASNLLGAVPAAQLSGNIPDAQLSTNIARLSTNQVFNGSNTMGSLTVGGPLSLAPSNVVPGDGTTLTSSRSFLRLNPSSPVTLNGTTAISNGSTVGSILILQGMHDVNTVTVPDNANVQVPSFSRVLGLNDTLTLIWNGTDWVEVSFTNN